MTDGELQARLEKLMVTADGLDKLVSSRLATVEDSLKRGRERFADHEARVRALEDAASAERGRASLRRWALGVGLTVIGLALAALKLLT